MEVLRKVKEKLGTFQVKYGSFKDIIEQFSSACYNEKGVTLTFRKSIHEFGLNKIALEEDLFKAWNVSRPDSSSAKRRLIYGEGSSGKVETIPLIDNYDGIESVNEKCVKVSKQFVILTPKKEMFEKVKCRFCNNKYDWQKSASRHERKIHPEEFKTSEKVPTVESVDECTCRMCSKKIKRESIARHVKLVHGYEKDDLKKTLKRLG